MFIYTKHVKIRISQRKILKEQIEETINEPDKEEPSFKGRFLAQKEFGNQILEVAYKRLNGDTVIITAYWLKKGE
jgi:hypothetical protein